MPTETKTCRKEKRVVDARVIAEFNLHWTDRQIYDGGQWRDRTPEEIGAKLEERCQAFREFMRDHRSQDTVTLEVERVVSDVCSACKRAWDPMTTDEDTDYARTTCGWCGAVEEN